MDGELERCIETEMLQYDHLLDVECMGIFGEEADVDRGAGWADASRVAGLQQRMDAFFSSGQRVRNRSRTAGVFILPSFPS
jgi:hypothetical protein